MEKQEQPMTEQQFLRVLTKNIAGILLCLAGLVYLTWAWYQMDIPCTNGGMVSTVQAGARDSEINVP